MSSSLKLDRQLMIKIQGTVLMSIGAIMLVFIFCKRIWMHDCYAFIFCLFLDLFSIAGDCWWSFFDIHLSFFNFIIFLKKTSLTLRRNSITWNKRALWFRRHLRKADPRRIDLSKAQNPALGNLPASNIPTKRHLHHLVSLHKPNYIFLAKPKSPPSSFLPSFGYLGYNSFL